MPHFLFKHVLWWLLRKWQLYGNTLKHFRNIINVPFAVVTFLLFCFLLLYPSLNFYNPKIKFNFFIFHMFSYFLWNFECFGFFFLIMILFCNFFKQLFVSVNSFLFLFYVLYCFSDAHMAISPLTSSIIYEFQILLFPSSFLPQVCLPILLFWWVESNSTWFHHYEKLGTLKLKYHKIFNVFSSVMKCIWEIQWDDVRY